MLAHFGLHKKIVLSCGFIRIECNILCGWFETPQSGMHRINNPGASHMLVNFLLFLNAFPKTKASGNIVLENQPKLKRGRRFCNLIQELF